jgi:hypothetical protein
MVELESGFSSFLKDKSTYTDNPKATAIIRAWESFAPAPPMFSKYIDMAICGIVKIALVIESQPARLSRSFVIDIHSSFRFVQKKSF